MRRVLTALVAVSRADFVYPHFNDTAVLRFNGDAATSSCEDGGPYMYDPLHGVNDHSESTDALSITEETGGLVSRSSTATSEGDKAAANVSRFEAIFSHRDAVGAADPAGCPVRLRLTPPRPFKAASVMRTERARVLDGFETGFTFQVSDHSRACTEVKDASFGPLSHRSCAVHGGDGLAFVMHGDPAGSGALGSGGGGMGYAGLANALVVELDTWYNPNPAATWGGSGPMVTTDDSPEDHVAVQASPPGVGGVVTPTASTRLGHLMRVPIGDGAIHSVRVVYYPTVRTDLLRSFSASEHLLPFLVDGGDARSIGTLAVYYDDRGGWGADFDATAPLISLPINLGAVLALPEDQAWMGFTSSTGRAWEKHDVLSWYACEAAGCPTLRADATLLASYYDSTGAVFPNATRDEPRRPTDASDAAGGVIGVYGPAAV
jgi:hypothetical protein